MLKLGTFYRDRIIIKDYKIVLLKEDIIIIILIWNSFSLIVLILDGINIG